MTTAPVGAPPLRERVAEEVRVQLARRRMSAAHLGRELGVSQTWVWRRLKGETAFDLDDLERIAGILGVAPVDLLPADVKRGGQPSAWRSPGGTQDPHAKVAHTDRPRDNRPSGRPDRPVTTHPGPRRPRRIPNPQPVPPAHIAA